MNGAARRTRGDNAAIADDLRSAPIPNDVYTLANLGTLTAQAAVAKLKHVPG
jgi:hypothetical protein